VSRVRRARGVSLRRSNQGAPIVYLYGQITNNNRAMSQDDTNLRWNVVGRFGKLNSVRIDTPCFFDETSLPPVRLVLRKTSFWASVRSPHDPIRV
jgi:hypothetical protein